MNSDHIQDIYPLSPTQQGMLFHSLYAPESGVYCQQFTCILDGDLEVSAFAGAWQGVVDNHPALRTAFFWEDVDEALQMVLSRAELPLEVQDWRHLSPPAQQERLDRYLHDDRSRGFDLEQPPLMRLFLARLRADSHQFVWSFHHLLLDGWSVPLVLQEFLTRYEGLRQGRGVGLPPARPYRDFIAWLKQQDLAEAEEAWRRTLRGFAAPTPLAVDRPATGAPVGFAEVAARIPAPVTSALQAMARQHQLTLNTLLQGAWALLLSRYSGEEDLLFGATVSGRPAHLAGVDQMVGLFINTLPVRLQTPPDASLLPWLKRLQEQQAQLRQYDYTPLSQIKGWSEIQRELPLFESILVFENQPLDESLRHPGGSLAVRSLRFLEQTNYPLTLVAIPGAELSLKLVYDQGRFAAEDITRMMGHLQTLLHGFLSHPDQTLASLPLLTDGERHQLLVEWTGSQSFPAGPCIHRLFEEQAALRPDAVALLFEEERLRYGELNRRANQLAHTLQGAGVGPEALVAIYMERSPDLVVAILATLKAGGAYLPLDPVYPQERIAFMLADAQVSVLLTTGSLSAGLPATEARIICLDSDWEEIAQASPRNPTSAVSPENLAYVIYTSGSTGRPKGTLVTHANVVRLMTATQPWFHFDETDVWTLFHSPAFDFSVWELWGALLYGGRLVLVPHWESRAPEAFHARVRRERVTVLNQTPSAFRQFIQADEAAGGGGDLSLRLVIFGGEALEPQTLQPWVDRHGDQRPRLINMYGITETTVHVTYRPITRADVAADSGSLIGRPIPDLRLYLLDRHGRPVPVGVPGEIHVGGAGVSRGYLNRPELTALRFIRDPFSPDPSARLYRSGDLARYRPDGDLEYLGRIDNQVKIRGFRVELGEIEAVLHHHPGVREAAVLFREGRLVAYLVPAAGQAPTVSHLHHFLRERLPDYMVPAAFVFLEAMPLTPNGKLDRKALPAPEQGRPHLGQPFAAPQTEAESLLAEAWRQVLRLEQVGVHDNFFELGGDSILSIQVVSRAAQAGLRLTPRQLFQHPTIAELAAVVGEASVAEAEQGAVQGAVPLTPIQHWFFEQELPEPHHWNQGVMLAVDPPIDGDRLERAVGALLLHHDALRLRFFRDETGGWRQVNAESDGAVPFTRVDLSHLPDAALRPALEAAAAQLQAGLALADGPLVRAALLDPGPDRPGRLLILIHHLAVDMVSWRILLEDLLHAYQRPALPLPPKTTSFRQWAAGLAEYARSAELQRELDFWLAQGSRTAAALPVDFPEGSDTEGDAATVSVSLSPEETRALLQTVPAAYRTRTEEILLTALLLAVSDWTGSDSLRVDLEGHGREEILADTDLSRTVGWFTAIFPALLERGEAPGPGGALKAVKEQLRRIPNRGVGYGLLRYLSDDPAVRFRLRALPQAAISFNYLGQLDQILPDGAPFRLAGESAGPLRSPAAPRRHALEVSGGVFGGRLRMDWRYGGRRFRPATVERLAQGFLAALQALVAHCTAPGAGGYTPSDFPLAGLDQERLDRLTGRYPALADLHPLSPAQQGMLFHSLADPAAYVVQMVGDLHGHLDLAAFEQAWQEALGRHAILRGACAWDGLDEPLLVVQQQVRLSLTRRDLGGLTEAEQEERLDALLREDRRRGFDLARPPLMRLTLLNGGAQQHRFVWSFHHLLLDGWSVPLLLKEVLQRYESLTDGRPVALEPVRPYRDYIAWLGRQDLPGAEAFWRQALQGFTAPTPLRAGEGPGRLTDRATYAERQARLSAADTAGLESLARQQRLTLNTLFLGAWALLLHRYSGEEDVLYGITVSGRPADLAGVETMVGLFINILPLRVRVPAQTLLLPWLSGLQSLVAEIRQYEYSPLVQLRRWSDLPPGLPLFESLLVFENYPVQTVLQESDGGLEVRARTTLEQTNYPLTLIIEPGEQLLLRALYDDDENRFDEAWADGLLGHLQTLLTSMAQNPHQQLDAIPLLSEAERRHLLEALNETRVDYPADRCIHHLFEAQVERTPEATAVAAESGSLTFRELNRQANRLAHALQGYGIGPDSLVGVCMDRSPAMVVALLAILKAGGAYVPLDPAYPPDRIAFMLSDSAASVLLSQSHLRPAHPARLIALDPGWEEEFSDLPTHNPAAPVSPSHLAYVIYTSGSTGTPKGVAIEHRATAAFLHWGRDQFTPADRAGVLASTSICFDLSVFELFLPLCWGGTVILADNALHLLTHPLAQQASLINTVPSAIAELLRAEAIPHSVRTINLAGEPLPGPLVQRLYQQTRAQFVYNLYGPSEDTTYSTFALIDRHETGKPSIGRPIANTQVYLLDPFRRPVPMGVPGELYLGGHGLARGYLGRPDLTAERFIPNPFRPGARLYRTGDLARYRTDGAIDFLGRNDQQVKIRGFRIELGEIEAVLGRHPEVRESVVMAREDESGEQRLVAYLVPARPDALTSTELRAYLRERLPDYMIPALFLFLPALPLTPNGKVDRKALPAPSGLRPDLETSYEPPRTELEQQIAQIWQEALGLARVGVNDNFFELGGHSLLAVKVHSRLRLLLERDLPMLDLFQYPTVGLLAGHLSRQQGEEPSFDPELERARRQREAMQRRRSGREATQGRQHRA